MSFFSWRHGQGLQLGSCVRQPRGLHLPEEPGACYREASGLGACSWLPGGVVRAATLALSCLAAREFVRLTRAAPRRGPWDPWHTYVIRARILLHAVRPTYAYTPLPPLTRA